MSDYTIIEALEEIGWVEGTEVGDAIHALIRSVKNLNSIGEDEFANTIVEFASTLAKFAIDSIIEYQGWDSYSKIEDDAILLLTGKAKLNYKEFCDKYGKEYEDPASRLIKINAEKEELEQKRAKILEEFR